ncbi:MAG: hypothetical protein BWY88_00441 [Synergistetes bacterium ADurb.Bin520]|nr:MAG: hypothetical protein BWY88_00441 [Synergistetes bacterium ADurb.Bin520]
MPLASAAVWVPAATSSIPAFMDSTALEFSPTTLRSAVLVEDRVSAMAARPREASLTSSVRRCSSFALPFTRPTRLERVSRKALKFVATSPISSWVVTGSRRVRSADPPASSRVMARSPLRGTISERFRKNTAPQAERSTMPPTAARAQRRRSAKAANPSRALARTTTAPTTSPKELTKGLASNTSSPCHT